MLDNNPIRYPIAPNGIFETIQGEGALLGLPMIFVRLAGCSIGCPQCDTDYSVAERLSPREIVERAAAVSHWNTQWVWITGGEPADHDILSLVNQFRRLRNCRIALATAGHKEIHALSLPLRLDWLSVSPHDPRAWAVKSGSELKLVPGLNGFVLSDFQPQISDDIMSSFQHHYVQVCDGKPDTLTECIQWVRNHTGWRLTPQAHKLWRIA